MTTLGCIQSSYIPWRGYFDIIRKSDIFVFHDDIQYTKQDWRNRNRIKTQTGPIWLTIPVKKETTAGTIDQVLIDNEQDWGMRHWRQIEVNYRRAPFFRELEPRLKGAFLSREASLSTFNIRLIEIICDIIGIKTPRLTSRALELNGRKTDRLIEMCHAVRADRYLSGPSARNYIEPEKFAANEIQLDYMDYQYRPYPQLFDGFLGDLSIIDLLFNCGANCRAYFNR